MVDENKFLKVLNIVKIVVIVAIVVGILFYVFMSVIQKVNTDRFYNYLKKENYKLDKYNIYVLETKKDNVTTTYQALANNYFLSKTTVETDDNGYLTRITLNYKKNKTIDIDYIYEGMNNNNSLDILIQKGTYKNGKLTKCKVINGNNLDTKCPEMRKNAKNYLTEINNILEKNKINTKYVKNSFN